MKYIIVGVDRQDETMWVLHGIYTHRLTAETAAQRNWRQETQPQRYTYKVCDIAEKELELFRDYAELQAPPVDAPEPPVRLPPWGSLVKAQRTEDFTLTELYGMYDGTESSERTINCYECGAVVSYDQKFLNLHQAWHNKLLP